MAATPYKPVAFSAGENITKEKMGQMNNNIQWLFENSPRMTYDANGIKRSSGLKVASGIVPIAPNNTDWGSGRVYFGNFFSVGCNPVVVGTVNANPLTGKARKVCSVSGVDTTPVIDHRGFQWWVWSNEPSWVAQPYFDTTNYFHWIAVGW